MSRKKNKKQNGNFNDASPVANINRKTENTDISGLRCQGIKFCFKGFLSLGVLLLLCPQGMSVHYGYHIHESRGDFIGNKEMKYIIIRHVSSN